MDQMKKRWRRYHFKNVTYICLSIAVATLLLGSTMFKEVLLHLGSYGYFGAFIGGMLFVSTFTVSIGLAILTILTPALHPVEVGIVAGLGGVIGDLVIFRFIRSKGLIKEIKHMTSYLGGDRLKHLIHTKYFGWSLPVLGALIVASPLPDELGIGLMGISKLNTFQFVILSYILNSIGIIVIVASSYALR